MKARARASALSRAAADAFPEDVDWAGKEDVAASNPIASEILHIHRGIATSLDPRRAISRTAPFV